MGNHLEETRMSLYENDRRQTRRHRTQLAIRVLVLVTKGSADDVENVVTCIGYTRDISESGLALFISARSIDESFLACEDCTMQLVLTLPTGSVDITAVPVRYERVMGDSRTDKDEEANADHGFLVGMAITGIGDAARSRYTEYINELLQA